MSELELRILDNLKTYGQYTFSPNLKIKAEEIDTLKNLEYQGYISIRTKALCYYVADVLE